MEGDNNRRQDRVKSYIIPSAGNTMCADSCQICVFEVNSVPVLGICLSKNTLSVKVSVIH